MTEYYTAVKMNEVYQLHATKRWIFITDDRDYIWHDVIFMHLKTSKRRKIYMIAREF